MGRRSEGACLHYRGAHLHDLGRAAANLLLTPNTLMVDPEMSRRSTEVTAWVSHFGARKLRVDEAIAELERAQRTFLRSRDAADHDESVEVRRKGEEMRRL
jgi:hypothetical protein